MMIANFYRSEYGLGINLISMCLLVYYMQFMCWWSYFPKIKICYYKFTAKHRLFFEHNLWIKNKINILVCLVILVLRNRCVRMKTVKNSQVQWKCSLILWNLSTVGLLIVWASFDHVLIQSLNRWMPPYKAIIKY